MFNPSRARSFLTAAALLAVASAAHAVPLLTTHAQTSIGSVSDTDGPQVGGALDSQISTTGGAAFCSIVEGNCAPGQLSSAHATAAQRETVFGIFSALEADGTFFVGGSGASNSLLARTTWQDSPTAAGPTSITLLIKPGELILTDYASILFGNATRARFRITLDVNGTQFFFSEAILQGGPGGPTLTESGTDLGGTPISNPSWPGNNVRGFAFDEFATTIDLGTLSPSDVVTYVMEVEVRGPGLETGGYARIGDPFDLSGDGSSIAFSTPVPEPSAALLLAASVGALALAFSRARRRARRR
jgi:hypothetical protein